MQINENKKFIKLYNQASCYEMVKMKYVIILKKEADTSLTLVEKFQLGIKLAWFLVIFTHFKVCLIN